LKDLGPFLNSTENYFKINYKVAQQFGIKISEGLLKQSAEIIYD
jgi:hypothetical protein